MDESEASREAMKPLVEFMRRKSKELSSRHGVSEEEAGLFLLDMYIRLAHQMMGLSRENGDDRPCSVI